MGRLFKFVFTGGPCGGKSTSIGRIRNFLVNRGFTVICIPEAATISFSNGIIYKPENAYFFQLAISSIQSSNERNFSNYAEQIAKNSTRDVVVLMDRSIIDGGAYCSKEEFAKILPKVEMRSKEEIMKSYDAVFFLVSAAKGAENFYGLEGVRFETAEEACNTDDRTFEVWKEHPKLYVFDNNNKTFEIKIKDVVSTVCSVLNIPHTEKIPRRFLMTAKDIQIPDHIQVTKRTIEKTFIKPTSKNSSEKARKEFTFIQSSNFKTIFYCVQKTIKIENDQRIETKVIITRRQYRALASFADDNHCTVHQKKTFFSLGSTHYEICDYQSPSPGLKLLSVYCPDDALNKASAADGSNLIPPFLEVSDEVTGDVAFSSHYLSRIDQSRDYGFAGKKDSGGKVVYRLLGKKPSGTEKGE